MSSRNTKNEYLLTGKIWCNCGVRRAGEGPQKGKHLYYRCTDRVKSFPLPSSCNEKGLNARIVDQMVWEKVAGLMTSPNLLLKQANRWTKNIQKVNSIPGVDIDYIKTEIDKLKEQENRYTKAYGAGVISIDQLKEHLNPIKEKIILLEGQISKVNIINKKENENLLPELIDVEKFTKEVSKYISDLNFNAKKAIIKNIIDKVVGNRENLQVYGFIPVTSNINVFTEYRNCRFAKCGEIHTF